eukprot:m.53676 g.53676  ORF g.53676 m.53676 type:complete len:159 (-) comp15453_c0_seq8:1872-2348(-)
MPSFEVGAHDGDDAEGHNIIDSKKVAEYMDWPWKQDLEEFMDGGNSHVKRKRKLDEFRKHYMAPDNQPLYNVPEWTSMVSRFSDQFLDWKAELMVQVLTSLLIVTTGKKRHTLQQRTMCAASLRCRRREPARGCGKRTGSNTFFCSRTFWFRRQLQCQ